jgi:hypothetical protein
LQETYARRVEKFEEAIPERKQADQSLFPDQVIVSDRDHLAAGGRHSIFRCGVLLLSLLMFVLFLTLVSLFNKHTGQRELLRQQKILNETELSCLRHEYQALPDGAIFADTSHPWSHDLDIFWTRFALSVPYPDFHCAGG